MLIYSHIIHFHNPAIFRELLRWLVFADQGTGPDISHLIGRDGHLDQICVNRYENIGPNCYF